MTESIVFELLESEQNFPIDFDDAWKWIGYSQKKDVLTKLQNNFDLNIDYIEPSNIENMEIAFGYPKAIKGGQNRKAIYLTIDCFKSLAMMANTSKCKEVRRL